GLERGGLGRQAHLGARGELLVGGVQILQQDAPRYAVHGQVVGGQQQELGLVGALVEVGQPEQGPVVQPRAQPHARVQRGGRVRDRAGPLRGRQRGQIVANQRYGQRHRELGPAAVQAPARRALRAAQPQGVVVAYQVLGGLAQQRRLQ